MKVYICGQKAFGAAVYELCKRAGHDVAGVCAPLLNHDNTRWDRLRAAALADNVPVLNAGLLRANLLPAGIDLIIAAHSHDFIGQKTRQKAKLGAVGYHPSLLPLYRGRDAVRWQVKLRERVSGGSVYWLNDNMDAGDIAAQQHVFVAPGESAEDVWRHKLFPLGVQLFARVLSDLGRGVIVSIPQDNTLATWFPSMDRPPVMRPDLPQIGPPPSGFTVVKFPDTLAGFLSEEMRAAHDIGR